MENFYQIFEVMKTASSKEILMAYENKISKFNNLKNLSKEQINEIKILKTGLYILSNEKLRHKYDFLLDSNKKSFEPLPQNIGNDDTLDSLFNVDNSWMKNHEPVNTLKKNKAEYSFNDRIFEFSNMNNNSLPNIDMDFRRIQQQGREDKSENKINK